MEPDDLFSSPLNQIVDFRFDEQVVRVFPDMLRRSVPGYGALITLSGIIAGEYVQAGSRVYDLGCSLGASTLAIRKQIQGRDAEIIAVDNSAAMVKQCRELLSQDPSDTPVTVFEQDICDTVISDASLVVLNLTLQFVAIEKRDALLLRIREGLRPGGVLLLTEKMAEPDAPHDRLHAAFKRSNGYSDLEISQKRAALENTLIPETRAAHEERLRVAGFAEVHDWFQCLQFRSLLAVC